MNLGNKTPDLTKISTKSSGQLVLPDFTFFPQVSDEQPPRFVSLAESLGLTPPRPEPETPLEVKLVNVKDPKEFADAVIDSQEFREYIVNGLRIGTLPGFTTLLAKIVDRSSWGKTPDKLELTGKNGEPLETVTTVRRVIVSAPEEENFDAPAARSERTH